MKTSGSILNSQSYQKQIASKEWCAFSENARKCQPYCTHCRRSDVPLTVHHIFYDWNRKLWEYEPNEITVLCKQCHDEMSKALTDFRKHVFGKLNGKSFSILNGALAVAFQKYDTLVFCHALAEIVSNQSLIENHAKAWNSEKQHFSAT